MSELPPLAAPTDPAFADLVQGALDGVPAAVTLSDLEGRLVHWNPASERLFGYRGDEVLGRSAVEVFDLDPLVGARIQRQLEAGLRFEGEVVMRCRDGSTVVTHTTLDVLRSTDGRALRMVGCSIDLRAQKRAEAALAANARWSEALGSFAVDIDRAGPDLAGVCAAVAARLGAHFGDSSIVRLISDDGAVLETAAVHHHDPAAAALMRQAFALPRPVGAEGVASEMILTGRPVFIPEGRPGELAVRLRPYRAFFDRHPCHGMLGVALWARGRIVGHVALARHEPGRPYVEGDLDALQALAERAGLAIENARLLRAVEDELAERRRAEAAVRVSEERWQTLLTSTSDLIVVLDADGTVRYTSPGEEGVLGYPYGTFHGREPFGLIHPDDAASVVEALAEAFAVPGVAPTQTFRLRHADGHYVPVDAVANNLLDDPAVGGLVITIRDATERQRGMDAVAALARRHAAVATLGQLAVAGGPASGLWHATVSAAVDALDVVGCALVEVGVDGPVVRASAGAPDVEGLDAAAARVLAEGQPLVEGGRVLVAVGGTAAPWGVLVAAGHDTSADEVDFLQSMANVVAAAEDQRRAGEDMRRQALHDALTGLPNRALLSDRLASALARLERGGSKMALLLLDLDRFKVVNDSLGHGAGDEVLVAVGERLLEAVRPGDTVARFAGDEFVVVCEGLAPDDDPLELADRVRTALRPPLWVAGRSVHVTASVGVAVTTRPVSAEELLADADAAMYESKGRGRDRVTSFDDPMRVRVVERLDTEAALRRALEEGQLRLHYQPVVGLSDAGSVSVEALVRWQHPELGTMAPARFIPVAEETGLVVPLGAWVLGEACRQVRRWRDGVDPNLSVAVNLSARQLADPGLVALVEAALAEAGLVAGALRLEVTESGVMDDVDLAVATLGSLRDLGVGIAVDDFGTGFSSLAYLKRLPLDALKVDRSFVDGLPGDPEDSAIVAAVVGLGRALDLSVVGEGVETEAQLATLTALGCDEAQGDLISPPLPPDQLEAWLDGGWRGTTRRSGEPGWAVARTQDDAPVLANRQDLVDATVDPGRRGVGRHPTFRVVPRA